MPAERRPILLVEDHRDTREMIATLLSSFGFDVVTAANGREGLQQLGDTRPCLILLDLMMPVMTGWEFRRAQQALADHDLASTPVVVVTASARADQSARDLNACGVLQKPVDFDVMLATVRRCGASPTNPGA